MRIFSTFQCSQVVENHHSSSTPRDPNFHSKTTLWRSSAEGGVKTRIFSTFSCFQIVENHHFISPSHEEPHIPSPRDTISCSKQCGGRVEREKETRRYFQFSNALIVKNNHSSSNHEELTNPPPRDPVPSCVWSKKAKSSEGCRRGETRASRGEAR